MSQLESPLFCLPAELRLQIYGYPLPDMVTYSDHADLRKSCRLLTSEYERKAEKRIVRHMSTYIERYKHKDIPVGIRSSISNMTVFNVRLPPNAGALDLPAMIPWEWTSLKKVVITINDPMKQGTQTLVPVQLHLVKAKVEDQIVADAISRKNKESGGVDYHSGCYFAWIGRNTVYLRTPKRSAFGPSMFCSERALGIGKSYLATSEIGSYRWSGADQCGSSS
ncbi:hypothetical protein EK21DRAFT_116102 [Setomelanomma holmii]|uniref:Uncharacterized protein n=1 Tax=Setomelanomma holmii TaxID=210430 RepID=A0A9P4H1F3_9PLEO|nr:hypothetical protein EK21DRAFT_116102 [Setomelanomma holmii]